MEFAKKKVLVPPERKANIHKLVAKRNEQRRSDEVRWRETREKRREKEKASGRVLSKKIIMERGGATKTNNNTNIDLHEECAHPEQYAFQRKHVQFDRK